MMHNWGFSTTNPIFEFKTLKFSVQLFTKSNRYDLDGKKCLTKTEGNKFILQASGFEWAGGQEKCGGAATLAVCAHGDRYTFDCEAEFFEPIKKVKIVLFDEQCGKIVAKRRYSEDVESGKILRYPNGWDDLFTPLITLSNDEQTTFYRSLDTEVVPKIFCVLPQENGKNTVELIYERDSRKPDNKITVPTWETGACNCYEEIAEEQKQLIYSAYKIEPWEKRTDVPAWAKEISLVVSIHGMHWSGHIFNDYKAIIKKLEWFKNYIDPKQVLVYIPGFDGRYYYKYCDYTPDKRMGGCEGMKELISYAHSVGYHIMPMFMINGASPDLEGFDKWGEPSRYYTPNGNVSGVSSCDWDTSRGYDLGCGVALNPGAPLWQDRFVSEVVKQVKEFKYDGVFLDLAAIYVNDPRYSTHEGCLRIVERLHAELGELLIGTEGWYDALSPAYPFSQCAGNNANGEMIWHDTPYAPFFDEANRCFGHLCLGDPNSGKNGVFEWGFNNAESRMPVRKGIIPTVTVLNDTLDNPKKILEIIKDAKKYYTDFIKK